VTREIYNSLASTDLNTIELVDPNRIDFYATTMAKQINDFWAKFARRNQIATKQVVDLKNWIADIILETSVQGASLIEVHVIDPAWIMMWTDPSGASFINVDEDGYLWPPIDVTFPPDISDATWRLCQVQASTDLTQPNIVLVFEDRIASELREHFKPQQSYPDQSRAEFIQSLIKDANNFPFTPGEVDIRFVHLLPHETFTAADLTTSQRLPASATQKYAPPARKHPNKGPKRPSSRNVPSPRSFEPTEWATLSIEMSLGEITGALTNPFNPLTPVPSKPTSPPSSPGAGANRGH
jgi:hypothetical protein